MEEYYEEYAITRIAEIYGVDLEGVRMAFDVTKLKNSEMIRFYEKVFDTLYFVGACLGALATLLIIVVLVNINGSLKSSLKLILSLAISDFCQSSLNIVLNFVQFDTFWHTETLEKHTWDMVDVSKKVLSELYFLSEISGLVTLVVLAVDILLAVRTPFKYRSLMSKRRGTILIVCVWLVSFLVVLGCTMTAELLRESQQLPGLIYVLIYGMTKEVFGGIFIVILGIYIAIVVEIRRKALRSISTTKQTKMALVFGMIIVCYMLGNVPFGNTIYFLWSPNSVDPTYMFFFTRVQAVTNSYRSLMNTAVYSVRLPDVRRAIRRLCKRRRDNTRWTTRGVSAVTACSRVGSLRATHEYTT